MRLRLLAAATGTLLLALPLATAAPASAAAPTRLTIHTSAHRAAYHQKVTITGRVTSGGVTLAGVRVTLAKRPLGARTWRVVGRDLTGGGPAGGYEFSRTAARNTAWRVSFAGTSAYDASAAQALVRVRREVTGKVVQPRTDVFFLTGRIVPDHHGQRVSLLRKLCARCAYRTLATQRTKSDGRYRARLPIPRKGSDFFKVRVRADRAFLRSDSPTWSLTRLG